MLDCDCKGIPRGEGQKRRKQTIEVLFPREILSLSNPGILMITGKEQIPVFDLAALNLRGSASTKKNVQSCCSLKHIYSHSQRGRKGIEKSSLSIV